MSKILNSEKELQRGKIYDLAKRASDAEYQRLSMFMDNEKERAKWNMEHDRLVSQNYEVLDDLERINKHKDILLRENERLRKQRENNRNPVVPFIRVPLADPFARRGQADAA